jgi:hypothetical protein
VKITKAMIIAIIVNFKSEYTMVIVSEMKKERFEFYMSSSSYTSSAD